MSWNSIQGFFRNNQTGFLFVLICMHGGTWVAFHDIGAGFLPPAPFALSISYRAFGCQLYALGGCVGFLLMPILSRFWKKAFLRPVMVALQMSACVACCVCVYEGWFEGIVYAQFVVSLASAWVVIDLMGMLLFRVRKRIVPAVSGIVVVPLVFGHAIPWFFLSLRYASFVVLLYTVLVALSACGYIVAWRMNEEFAMHDSRFSSALRPPRFSDFVQSGGKPLFFHILSYGAIFGIAHVFPTGSGYDPILRSVPYLVGALCAGCVPFVVFGRSKGELSVRRIWSVVSRAVFPLTMVSFFLMPLIITWAYPLPAISSQASSAFYAILLLLGCWLVAEETRIHPIYMLVFCSVALYIGKELGMLGALVFSRVVTFTSLSFSVLSAVMFLLLTAATLEFGVDKHIKTLWGLCEKTTPKAHHDAVLERRCNALADEYGLTNRERQILILLAQGQRPVGISNELVISTSTARTHIQRVYRKLSVHSESELLAFVRRDDRLPRQTK